MGGWIEENTRETGNCRGIDFQSYLIPEKSTMRDGGVKWWWIRSENESSG